MSCSSVRSLGAAALAAVTLLAPTGSSSAAQAQTDLDAFMQQVLAHRDENWKKLQQYLLDEREQIDVRGPRQQPVWGERRDYSWYIRDGYFVRSPVSFNGVAISEEDRRKYEADFLRREREREKRYARRNSVDQADAAPAPAEPSPGNVDGLLRQVREPGFISSAYFLRFKFESGKYAFVGRETLDGKEMLRVEYYPTRLFSHEQDHERRRREAGESDPEKAREAEYERLINKVSLVTLWIEPSAHQIVKYTFKNIDADFLPAQWLVRVGDFTASMMMGQPFPNIWLPRSLDAAVGLTFASGSFDVRYAVEYHDYRQADVKAAVRPPRDR
jgi:hypothetical protein